MNPSRRAATRAAVRPARAAASGSAVASATAPATFSVPDRRPRSCPPPWISGSSRVRPRTNSTPLPLGAPSLWPEMLSASTPSASASSGSQPAACTASVWNGTPVRAGQRRELGDGLDRADLVVGVHDADQRRVRAGARRRGPRASPARSASTGTTSTAKPWTRSRYRADSSTAGCSTALIATRSRRGSAARRARAMPLTARLSASVPPEVKMTSPGRQPRALARCGAGLRERRGGRLAERVVARRVAELAREVGPHGLEHLAADRGGGGGVEEDHGAPQPAAGPRRSTRLDVSSMSRPRSRAVTLWVRAPTEMTSTPVAAMSATVSRLTLPLASTRARPPTSSTPAAQVVQGEVVQHDGVHPGGEHGLDLLERVDLHLEVGGVAELGLGAAQHCGQLRRVAAGEDGQVVVLGQHGVGEAEAVVGAAAAAHGVAFEHPQPRRRLAGVGDAGPGAGHERHELGRLGGDAAHPLDQVQADALGQQHGAGVPGHPGQGGSGVEGLAVGDQQFDDGARVGQLHRRGEHLPAAEHAGHPGVEHRRRRAPAPG